MNEQEAIKIIESSNAKLQTAIGSLQGSAPVVSDKLKQKYGYTLEEALNEKKACELAIKALEKQIPMKPKYTKWVGIDDRPYELCPNCDVNLCTDGMFKQDKPKFCNNCGQRLEW